MKKSLIASFTLIAAALTTTSAMADLKLATDKNCMACHAVDKKMVGPGYKDIAAKYATRSDAVDYLSNKIMKGGANAWGPIPMPANAQVNAAEAKTLATWVLSLK